jgi:acyl-CoA thioesterase
MVAQARPALRQEARPRNVFTRDGRLIASVCQEGLMRELSKDQR